MKGKRLDVWRRGLPSEGVFDLLTCLPCCFPSSFPARLEQTTVSTLGDRSTNGSLEETFCFTTGAKQYQLVWGQWLRSSWSALSDNPTGNNSWPSPEPGMPGSEKKKRASSHFWVVWNSKTHHGILEVWENLSKNHWNASKFPLPGLFALHSCDGCDCWLCVTTRRSVESFWWGQSKNNDPDVFNIKPNPSVLNNLMQSCCAEWV